MPSVHEISDVLEEIAVLLELKGDNPFRVSAYRKAARSILSYEGKEEDLLNDVKSGKISGIGKQLAEKIEILLRGSALAELRELKASIPPGLEDLLKIAGLGPKRVRVLYQELGISNFEQLEEACRQGRIAGHKGFGKKVEDKILQSLSDVKSYRGQLLYSEALEVAEIFIKVLEQSGICKKVALAGEARLVREVISQLVIIVVTDYPWQILEFISNHEQVERVVDHAEDLLSLELKDGLLLRIVYSSEESFGTTLFKETGNSSHVNQVSNLFSSKIKTSSGKGNSLPVVSHEEEIYSRAGISFVPPELREGAGEVEEAMKGKNIFPRLVTSDNVRGVLHVHTSFSDGRHTLLEMAIAAREMGYEYIGISDHSTSAFYAGGLHDEDILRQHRLIDELNSKLEPFHIFKGIESDIKIDGSLDYSQKILDLFDFVIISIHSRMEMDQASMTKRVLKAIRHPNTTLLAHPTGRLLLDREPYAIDLEEVLKVAAAEGVGIELNAKSQRFDLDWRYLKKAKDLGIKIPIGSDAHSIDGIDDVKNGIVFARKGWLTEEDIPNCWTATKIEEFFNFRKRKQ